MMTTKTPIGEIINYLYKNEGFYNDELLLKEINNLVDLMLIRTKKEGFANTLQSLKGDLFELRIKLINHPRLFQDFIENIGGSIQKRIELQFGQATNHKNLELAYVNSINIYGQIAKSTIDKNPENPQQLPKIGYEDYVDFLENLPGKGSHFYLPYLNSSITLDFSLIASELVFDGELKLNKAEINDLVLLLKNSVEEYAVFSNKFGLWTPNDSDESQWARNIKIRIGLFESQFQSDDLSSGQINEMMVA